MKVTLIRPQHVRGENGFEIWSNGRFYDTYKHPDGRMAEIPVEGIYAPFLRVDEKSYRLIRFTLVREWTSPASPMTDGERAEVRANVKAAYEFELPEAFRFDDDASYEPRRGVPGLENNPRVTNVISDSPTSVEPNVDKKQT